MNGEQQSFGIQAGDNVSGIEYIIRYLLHEAYAQTTERTTTKAELRFVSFFVFVLFL